MENNRFIKYLGIILSLVIILFTFLLIFNEKYEFSENENRFLQDFPVISLNNFFSNRLTKELDNFVNDHFPFRNSFVKLKNKVELLNGKTNMNNVFIGSDDYLIEDYKTSKKLDSFINVINDFKNNNDVLVTLMLVPNSVLINEYKLPYMASTINQYDDIKYVYSRVEVDTIDLYDTLVNNNKKYQMYYKLDHHWTSYGAYFSYVEYAQKYNLDYLELDEYDIEEVTDKFYGTLFSKVILNKIKGDKIHIFNKDEDLIVKYYLGNNVVTKNSLYEYSYLDKKDKYSMFLNNNNPLVTIKNNLVTNNRKILVIKDSYANSFIPFLTSNYEEIHVIDPRYYKESISNYINEFNIEQVLFLYNMNNLDSDTGIYSIK